MGFNKEKYQTYFKRLRLILIQYCCKLFYTIKQLDIIIYVTFEIVIVRVFSGKSTTFDPTICHINTCGPTRHKKSKCLKNWTFLSNSKISTLIPHIFSN